MFTMQKNLIKLIAEGSNKLTKMFEENKPYNEILKQSKILYKYISGFYKRNNKSR